MTAVCPFPALASPSRSPKSLVAGSQAAVRMRFAPDSRHNAAAPVSAPSNTSSGTPSRSPDQPAAPVTDVPAPAEPDTASVGAPSGPHASTAASPRQPATTARPARPSSRARETPGRSSVVPARVGVANHAAIARERRLPARTTTTPSATAAAAVTTAPPASPVTTAGSPPARHWERAVAPSTTAPTPISQAAPPAISRDGAAYARPSTSSASRRSGASVSFGPSGSATAAVDRYGRATGGTNGTL